MTTNDPLKITEGSGSRGGMTIQIGVGWRQLDADVQSIYLTDEAWCFVEPIVVHAATNYEPIGRWGVTEIAAPAWRLAVTDLRSLAARLGAGQLLSRDDFAWIHTVDLDNDTEIDSEAFGRSYNEHPIKLATLRDMLVKLADWIEQSLQAHQALTVYGY